MYASPQQHLNRRWRLCAHLAPGLRRRDSRATLEGEPLDSNHFDSLARSLTAAGSRRRALALALSGALGLFGLAHADDAAAGGKCKPQCKECKKCKKGKHGKKGKCKPTPNGTACSVGSCQNGSCAVPACGAGGPCRVFLSSTTYNGNLGGLSGADAKCQGLATAAGLPGTYKAWLSDSTGSPSTRFVQSSGPYQLVSGTTIATNFNDLTDGTLLAPISVTQTGGGGGAEQRVWTNTKIDGAPVTPPPDEHCTNWSTNDAGPGHEGDAGDSTQSTTPWTQTGGANCGALYHLYCFQQS